MLERAVAGEGGGAQLGQRRRGCGGATVAAMKDEEQGATVVRDEEEGTTVARDEEQGAMVAGDEE
jgi:hypothetical protein